MRWMKIILFCEREKKKKKKDGVSFSGSEMLDSDDELVCEESVFFQSPKNRGFPMTKMTPRKAQIKCRHVVL